MISLKQPFYFCNECKKVLDHLDDLLFIDEFSHKGFCSEECIEDFYFPLIKHFEIVEHSMRSKLGLLQESSLSENISEEIVEAVLSTPDEVFKMANEVQENYYNFIKHYPNYTAIVIAGIYRKEASFVYISTITQSQKLITEYRYGESVTEWFKKGQLEGDEIDAEEVEGPHRNDFEGESLLEDENDEEAFIFLQLLESKKSKVLADIIINRSDDDIPFEDYPGYEFCFQETLDQPDEVFEKKDNEGDMIFTYIKSFSRGDRGQDSFFYIVICLKRKTDESSVSVYPILGVPTSDIKMCQQFRGGTRLSGPIKN